MGLVSAMLATCGNGTLESPETCDDGGTSSGDGCTDGCQEELGWSCSGSPSSCTEMCASADYRGFVNHEYIYCAVADDWVDAQTSCQSLGTGWDLVQIDTKKEDYLVAKTSYTLNANNYVWIGLTDQSGENGSTGTGDWRWPDESTPSGNGYTNWGWRLSRGHR